jgi:flagellar biosynthesis/type III secretory pathway M-ring protein FliF/YscJ
MATALSLMVLSALALAAGGSWLWRRQGPSRQALLMLVLAAVIAANIALIVWPAADGASPLSATP